MGKRGRRLPILSAADLICVIEADGWQPCEGTRHLAWEHPTKQGKVNIDAKWEHIRPSGWPLTSVLSQAGLTKEAFEALYWEHRR